MAGKKITDKEIAILIECDSDLEFEINAQITDTEDSVEDLEDTVAELNASENEIVFTSSHELEQPWPAPSSSRRREFNSISEDSDLGSTSSLTIGETFALFISGDMVKDICCETNHQVARLSMNRIEPIVVEELYAFIAIMLASGRNRSRKLGLNDLWINEDPFCQPFFPAAMSRDRFITIFSQIRFDDKETRKERFIASSDRLEPIKSILNKFVNGCNQNYSPVGKVTVDERLVSFKGNCPFRVNVRSKPGRHGIKMRIATDSSTAYVLDVQVYTGVGNNGVVVDLVQPQHGTIGTGLITDNLFNSSLIGDKLLNKSLTGNGKEISKEFLQSSKLLLNQFSEDVRNKTQTKGAVVTGDIKKIIREYSCVRSTRRWPFRIFMELLDIAELNAYSLWTQKHPEWKANNRNRRKCFIRELSLELAKPNIVRRKSSALRFHNQQRDAIDTVVSYYHRQSREATEEDPLPMNIPIEYESKSAARVQSRSCRFCPSQTKKRTRLTCHICKKPVCISHRIERKYISCSVCDQWK